MLCRRVAQRALSSKAAGAVGAASESPLAAAAAAAARVQAQAKARAEHPSLEQHMASLEASTAEREAVARFEAALAHDDDVAAGARAQLKADYELLVTTVSEKMRLTVDWNDTAKLTEKQRVAATARRVGLSVDPKPPRAPES